MNSNEALAELKRTALQLSAMTARSSEHQALKGFLLGALHGLSKAAQLGFRDQTGPQVPKTYDRDLTRALRSIASSAESLRGQWLSGFFFNAGLQRLAAVYHRGLKALVGRDRSVACLEDLALAAKLLPKPLSALRAVDHEVNDLKHRRDGLLLKGRYVDFSLAVAASNEAADLVRRVIAR